MESNISQENLPSEPLVAENVQAIEPVSPEQEVVKKKFRVKYIVVIIFLVLLVIVVVAIFAFLRIKEEKTVAIEAVEEPVVAIVASPSPSPTPTPEPEVEATTLIVPELPALVNWSEPERIEDSPFERVLVSRGKEDVFYFEILKGSKVTTSEADGGGTDYISEIDDYYETELSSRGWDNIVFYDGYRFQGTVADGSSGSVIGRVGIRKGILKVLTVTYHLRSDSYSMEIYESDEVPVDEIIKRAIEAKALEQ